MYTYNISGYYFANDERKYFNEDVTAENNSEAMANVIGHIAWQESIKGNTFKLDTIHYEFLHECL